MEHPPVEPPESLTSRQPALQLLLLAALAQGLALRFLTRAMLDPGWLNSHPGLLGASLALAIFLVPAGYALAEWSRAPRMWAAVAGIAVLLACVGYHGGAMATRGESGEFRAMGPDIVALPVTLLFMFHLMPFLQCAVNSGRWQWPYARLFEFAWRNALRLALAALFTAVSWLLLWTAAMLFDMLGFDFLSVLLFRDTGFFWLPVSLAFGVGVHFADNSARLMLAARTLVLSLLKWLAAAAALILAMFSIALLIKTPSLLLEQRRVISATWLLWLAALNIYLCNAGFQDGSEPEPYPRRLGVMLRLAMPLLLLVCTLALYAVGVRIAAYGLTVPRIWGLLVAVTAFAYAIGYVWAARRASPWMAGMARVNMTVAAALTVMLFLMLTPILSPARMTAANLDARLRASAGEPDGQALRMLRTSTGRYGTERLQRLADAVDTTVNSTLRAAAQSTRQSRDGIAAAPRSTAGVYLDSYPVGTVVDEALRAAVAAQPMLAVANFNLCTEAAPCPVLQIDLDADGSNEALVFLNSSWVLYESRNGQWQTAGAPIFVGCVPDAAASGRCGEAQVRSELAAGNYALVPRKRADLRIGGRRLAIPDVP